VIVYAIIVILTISSCSNQGVFASKAVPLRLSVALTPQELGSFQQAIQKISQEHPEWELILETVPQSGVIEKINSQIAGNNLPDVIRIQGLLAQQWIRQGVFLELNPFIRQSQFDLTDFYSGPLDQFIWNGKTWGLPDSAAPDVVFYNKAMFDELGLAYPNDKWTYEDMRSAAITLTRDSQGRSPTDPGFDASSIQQWGWNGGLTYFWQRHLARGFGGDFCANEDCTLMDFTSENTLAAVQWWADLVNRDKAALYDPYGGSQTGIPGDPFIADKAAMGYNGFFAVGQLNDVGNIDYDIIQPLIGIDGRRYTPISTNGYVITTDSRYPDQAWELIQELLDPELLAQTWGQPGHSVPARRSVAGSILNPQHPPQNQTAILAAMEYGEVFKPYTSSAFEVYARTIDDFTQAMKGEVSVEAAMTRAEITANEILSRDRQP
jgi:multiple sugar transport system substrate-binding protein